MNGEQLAADIYMGPTYYMRLKHMVKDKINYRARGPNTALTRQPVQGRANDGGLRIGEMERDGVLAHGMSYFLNESFMVRGEKQSYYIAVCNKTGAIAIYNEPKNLFLSPYSDGPIKFNVNPDGSQSILNLSRFGRSFSILRVPYAFKLLIHELQVMNVQMRIVTEDNVDQLLSMNYSNNINKLLHNKDEKDITETIKEINENITKTLRNSSKFYIKDEIPVLPEPVNVNTTSTPGFPDVSPAYVPDTPLGDAVSPAYIPEEDANSSSTPDYYERKELINGVTQVQTKYNYPDDLGYYYLNLSEQEKQTLLNKSFEEKVAYLKEVKDRKLKELSAPSPTILEVEQAKPEEEKKTNGDSDSSSSESSSGEKKTITIQEPEESSSSSSSESSGTRKFTL